MSEPVLATSDLVNAVKNRNYGEFTLENTVTGESRTFEIRDLPYDDYLDFCSKARPIITAVSGSINIASIDNVDGKDAARFDFDPLKLDFGQLIALSGKELPYMAWLCCRQSDASITEREVKRLARRPIALLHVVLMQIKHNALVEEFVSFFQQKIAPALEGLMPEASAAAARVPVEDVA